ADADRHHGADRAGCRHQPTDLAAADFGRVVGKRTVSRTAEAAKAHHPGCASGHRRERQGEREEVLETGCHLVTCMHCRTRQQTDPIGAGPYCLNAGANALPSRFCSRRRTSPILAETPHLEKMPRHYKSSSKHTASKHADGVRLSMNSA